MLLASAAQAHDIGTTRFVPENYHRGVCRALSPQCMTKKQWASYCKKNIPHSQWPQSCRDATASHNHKWPRTWLGADPMFGISKDPVPKHLLQRMPKRPPLFLPSPSEPSTRFLPEFHTGPTCMAFMPQCMTRAQWAKYCVARRNDDPNFVFPKSCRDALGVRPIMPRRYRSNIKKPVLPMDALLGRILKHQSSID